MSLGGVRIENQRTRGPLRATVIICLVCLAITALATWAAHSADESSEHRLLEGQTKQAGAVLSTAILLIQEPLDNALSGQKAAGAEPDPTAFRRLMTGSVAPGRLFVSASLWKRSGGALRQVAQIGAPGLDPQSARAKAYLSRAFTKKTFTVRSVTVGEQSRIGYALADPGTGYVVYAERAIPANRRAPVDSDSAFADLHYAIYLGTELTDANLSTTDVQPSRLPLTGSTAQVKVPFGDTVLVLVTKPRKHLGAPLTERLPLILLLSGLLLTVVAARTVQQLSRGRQAAEHDAATITELYERVEAMYGQQRELSVRLQRALLPQVNPDLPNLEIASEYVAGARGVDIGGDWYSIIGLGRDTFGFVVGDVSGNGVDAVAVMAHARFTLRTYLLDGHGPAAALEKSSRQFDIAVDGHMTTAIVGRGNWRTGEITLANAGHPAPLLLTTDDASFVATPIGPPLGVSTTPYEATTITLPPGSTLFCFTDGLVERRGEGIDVGMARLASTALEMADGTVDDLVAHALQRLRHDDDPDDVAILAMRWVPGS